MTLMILLYFFRTTEINHLKEQAQKDRLMKASAQAAITSYRVCDTRLNVTRLDVLIFYMISVL